MNNDKRTTRELALEWWKLLTIKEREQYYYEYKYLAGKFTPANNESELTGREIEILFSLSFPEYTQTETKKEEGKEGDILEGITQGEWEVQGLEVRNNKNEFVANCMCKFGSAKEDYANARLISLAPQLAKENKRLVEENEKLSRGISEMMSAAIEERDKKEKLEEENKSLREANERLKEALEKVADFLHILPSLRLLNKDGFDACVNIEAVLELEGKAKEALTNNPK